VVVRLADDRRGRVPFAIVGVLVLVGAATFAAGLETTGPSEADRAADVAVERLTASSTTAVREAVRDAAREAALHPVTDPANTTAGRVIDRETAFRDALRLRIYVRSRAYLRTASHERDGVRATASLRATPDADSLDEALSQVRLRSVDNGTALQVRLRNVSVRAERAGRTLVATNRTLNVTVATPVLTMHDHAERYERRLNTGVLDGPGLGRQVTARLFAVAWARGYAQHAGAPVEQVLATRHVEVATNDAVLRTQRATFGHADPVARRRLREAAIEDGIADLSSGAPVGGGASAWAWNAAEDVEVNATNRSVAVPSPAEAVPLRVGGVADRTTAGVVRADVGEPHSLGGALRESHRADASLRTRVEAVAVEDRPDPSSPGAGWERAADDDHERVTETVTNASGPLPEARGDERTVTRFARRVEREHTVSRTWKKGNRTRTTEARWTETYRVGVAVVVEHAPDGGAPDRKTRPLFERGGALGGDNLADAPVAATDALLDDAGGRDRVAVGVLTREARTSAVVYGERPENLSRWVRRDLHELNGRVRNVSTNASATALGTMRVNPAAELAAKLRARRAELVAAPPTYDGVADRARVAARARYVDAVIDRLDARAAKFRRMRRAYERSLDAAGVASLDSLAARVDAGRNASRTGATVVRGDLLDARLTPQASPAYLTTDAVAHEDSRAVPRGRRYHPLVTRNVNVFTVPYEDTAAAVSGAVVSDPERVDLGTAGRTLGVANRTVRARADETLRRERDELQRAVEAALRPVERRAAAVLGRATGLPPTARWRVVEAAGERWTTAERARAAANGSLATAVAAEAAAREDVDDAARTRLARRLRVATADAVDGRAATVPARRIDGVATHARRLARRTVEERVSRTGARATERAAERWVGDAFAAVPSGLPVVPPPYTWYATVNVWTVDVEGAYARFTLRTRRDAPGGRLRYVRDGTAATLDVDGDGTRERLGRSERVSFETSTAVFVVVPPNGRGVGDSGVAVETSAGWPEPSCTAPLSEACPAE
jgi:hypothetical protein